MNTDLQRLHDKTIDLQRLQEIHRDQRARMAEEPTEIETLIAVCELQEKQLQAWFAKEFPEFYPLTIKQ